MILPKKWLSFTLGISLLAGGVARADVQYKECLGAYELTLPGKVEFALFPEAYLVNQESSAEAVFSDGSTASDVRFFPGSYVGLMAAPDSKSLAALKAKVSAAMEKHKQELIHDGREDIAKAQAFYELHRPNSFSTRGVATVHHYEWIRGNIYHFTFDRDSFADNVSHLKKFLANFRPRQPYEMPDASKICMPYAEVLMPFNVVRNVSVEMLLKDHPEVEIQFRDVLHLVTERSEAMYSPEHQLTYHWQRRNRGEYSKVDYAWPKFDNITIDGMSGKSTFVTLFRAGGIKDRGYAAYVNSEKEGIQRKLMLIVTRDSSRASGPPISTDEFDKLAKAIAHSIRRRVP